MIPIFHFHESLQFEMTPALIITLALIYLIRLTCVPVGRRKPPQSESTRESTREDELPRRPEPRRRREFHGQNESPRQSEISQRSAPFGTATLRPSPICPQMESQYYQQMPRGTDKGHFNPPRPSRPFTGPPGRPANRTSDSTFAGCSFGNFMATSVYEMPPPLPDIYNKPYQPGDEVIWSQQSIPRSRYHGDRKAEFEDDESNRSYEHGQFTNRFRRHVPVQAQTQNRLQNRSRLLPLAQSQAQAPSRRLVPAAPAITSREQARNLHFATAPTENGKHRGDDEYFWSEHEPLNRLVASHPSRHYHQTHISRPVPLTERRNRVGNSTHDHEHFSDHVFARSPRPDHFPAPRTRAASTSKSASPAPAAAPAHGGQKRTYDHRSAAAGGGDAGDEGARRKKSRGNGEGEDNRGDKNEERAGDEVMEGDE